MLPSYGRWLLIATILSSSASYGAEPPKLTPPDAVPPAAIPHVVLQKDKPVAETVKPIPAPVLSPEPAKQKIFSNKLRLKIAIEKALAASPRLRSAEAGVNASLSEQKQAGAWQNPEIGVSAENFAGGGNYRNFQSSEVTVGVSQVIEMGGKRGSRKAIAEQDVALSRHSQSAEKLDVIRDTSVAYANAVAAQQMLKLTAEQKTMARTLFKEVGERVDAAREPLFQKSKAEITLSTASFAYERAERELTHAKQVLSSMWGVHEDSFQLEENDFTTLTTPLAEHDAEERMGNDPSFKRYQATQGRMKARYELEKAQAIPDPRINVGVRELRESGDRALVAGISIPIPVFNGNQGNIGRARQEVSKAEHDTDAARLSLTNTLHEALESQVNAFRRAKNMKESILPSAEKAFALSREGYRAGRFPYLEVLDAQRTLFDVKEQYITTLKEYQVAKAEVERLTASNLSNQPKSEESNEKH